MRHLELLGQNLENVIRIDPKKSSVISSAHFFFRMVQTGEAGKTTQSDLFEGDLAGVWLDSLGGEGPLAGREVSGLSFFHLIMVK